MSSSFSFLVLSWEWECLAEIMFVRRRSKANSAMLRRWELPPADFETRFTCIVHLYYTCKKGKGECILIKNLENIWSGNFRLYCLVPDPPGVRILMFPWPKSSQGPRLRTFFSPPYFPPHSGPALLSLTQVLPWTLTLPFQAHLESGIHTVSWWVCPSSDMERQCRNLGLPRLWNWEKPNSNHSVVFCYSFINGLRLRDRFTMLPGLTCFDCPGTGLSIF